VNIIVQRTDTHGGVELICPCCRKAGTIQEFDIANRVNHLASATLDETGALQLAWSLGDGTYEHAAYGCSACFTEPLTMPNIHIISDYA
jgi:hypothetical protein